MATIPVPASFIADWKIYCDGAGLDRFEQNIMRDLVRADIAVLGPWVSKQARIYEFCEGRWGGVPSVERLKICLEHHCWFPEDKNIFTRCGVMLLAELCFDVVTAIEAKARIAQQSEGRGLESLPASDSC